MLKDITALKRNSIHTPFQPFLASSNKYDSEVFMFLTMPKRGQKVGSLQQGHDHQRAYARKGTGDPCPSRCALSLPSLAVYTLSTRAEGNRCVKRLTDWPEVTELIKISN